MKKINESLLPELLRRDFGKDIFEGLSTHHYINVKGSAGSVPSLIAAELFTVQNKTLLFITDDKEAAFYITSEMKNLVGEKRVLYFPETHLEPYQIEKTQNANIVAVDRRASCRERV